MNKEYIVLYSTIKEGKFTGSTKDDVKKKVIEHDNRAIIMDIREE